MKENRNPKCACSCVCVCVCVCVCKRQRKGEKWACIKFHTGLLLSKALSPSLNISLLLSLHNPVSPCFFQSLHLQLTQREA